MFWRTCRKALVAGLMVVGSGALGCHAALPRLSAQGRHAEVVARAGKARILPRGKAARAWATSLVALGRADEARAVLLRDFRTHAELASLVALADLEAAEGLFGLAAAHYARAASLEVEVLSGRSDVCELLRRRAGRFFAEGEALAADLDLRRVAMICPRGQAGTDEVAWRADRALHERVIVAAKEQARAQRTLRGCEGGRCQPAAPGAEARALASALATARAAGPAALRSAAARLGTKLAPGDVAELLAAELRGELGVDLVDLDELRGWIGEAPAADVVAAADAQVAAIERDYVRLRLSQLGAGYELPGDDAARSQATAVIRLLEAADDDPAAAAMAWRVFALIGDLPSAEMALAASLGGRPTPGRSAAAAEELARETGRGDGTKMAAGTGTEKMSAGTGGAKTGVGAGDGKSASGTGESRIAAGGAKTGAGTGDGKSASGTGESRSAAGGATTGAGAGDSKLAGGTGDSTLAAGTGDARPAAGAGEPAQRLVPPPGLWSARAEVDASTLPRLLLLARLRGTAGRRDQALAIAAFALAEAHARGLAVQELAAAEARRELAAGRPWTALALAAVVPGAATADVTRAAGSALVLERAACGERCGDPDDRAAVRQVFGEPWLLEQEEKAMDAAYARQAAPAREGGCPLLSELLAPGASGPLSAALRRARTEGLGAPGLGEALRRAIEADLTLECAGRIAVPLMYAIDARVAAGALSDELAHAPQEIAGGQLEVQAELALILGRRDQADMLAQAAAGASADPRRVWRRAAAMAALVDARHYELLALRQLLLHGVGGAEADEVRLRLAVRGLRDADDAWAPRHAEAGREALIRGVTSYLDSVPADRRWHAREALAFALAEYTWADEEAAALIRAALWPDDDVARRHPAGVRRLERAFGGGEEPGGAPHPLAPRELAAALARPTPLGSARGGADAARPAPDAGGRMDVGKDMSSGTGASGPVSAGSDVMRDMSERAWSEGQTATGPGGAASGEGGAGALERASGGAAVGSSGRGGAAAPGSSSEAALELPPATEALCAAEALEPARVAALTRRAPGEARTRAAIALAVTGARAETRTLALRTLLAGLEPQRRAAVLDAVIVGLQAAPGGAGAPLIDGDDALLAVVFDLARDPRRRPREIKGQEG